MTETREPTVVGEELDQVVGQLYHQQMLNQYWQAGEQITLNAMVMLCLAARRFDEAVKYVLLDDSDQGDWQAVAGLSSGLPVQAGDFVGGLDLDPDCVFDDEGWASSVDDRTAHVWQPFIESVEVMLGWHFLDIDKVLAEVHLPWRPVTQVTHGPDPASWFGRGRWPECSCGYAPKDNLLLAEHWAGQGFAVIEISGSLVKRDIETITAIEKAGA